MPHKSEPDETKLPQWAQTKLQNLRGEVEHWRKQALDPLGEGWHRPGNPRVQVLSKESGVVYDEIALPTDHVRYEIGGDEVDVTVRDTAGTRRGMRLAVAAVHGYLEIEPVGGNIIQVWVRPW